MATLQVSDDCANCINRAARTGGAPAISHRHAISDDPVTPQKVGPDAIPITHPTSFAISSRQISNPTKLHSGIDSARFTAATRWTPLSSSSI
jgi:hypothetical protein